MAQFKEIQESFDREQQLTLEQLQKERSALDDRERAINDQQKQMEDEYERLMTMAKDGSNGLSPISEGAESEISANVAGVKMIFKKGEVRVEEFDDPAFLREQIDREEHSYKREINDYQMARDKLDLTWEQFKSFEDQLEEGHKMKAKQTPRSRQRTTNQERILGETPQSNQSAQGSTGEHTQGHRGFQEAGKGGNVPRTWKETHTFTC